MQRNPAVRPPAEQDVRPASANRLEEIARALGPRAEIIAPAPVPPDTPGTTARRQEVLDILRRRPCTANDIAAGLGISPRDALGCLRALQDEGLAHRRQRLYETYYEASDASAP